MRAIALFYDGDVHCMECAQSQYSNLYKAVGSDGIEVEPIESIEHWLTFDISGVDDPDSMRCIDCDIEIEQDY